MKKLLFMFLLFGCSKADDVLPEPIHEPVIICNQFKTGRYLGKHTMDIPGNATVINTATREIYQEGDSLVIRWWSCPDTTATALIQDTLTYIMTYDRINTSCGHQRSVYDFTATSYMINDSLFESGTVHYRFWYEGRLLKDITGTWSAKFRWIDKLTPNKP